jgi:hypothetical protein
VSFDQFLGRNYLLLCQAVILRQRNGWLKPELCLSIWAGHMDVHRGLFAGEEVKSETAVAKYGGTQGLTPTLIVVRRVAASLNDRK